MRQELDWGQGPRTAVLLVPAARQEQLAKAEARGGPLQPAWQGLLKRIPVLSSREQTRLARDTGTLSQWQLLLHASVSSRKGIFLSISYGILRIRMGFKLKYSFPFCKYQDKISKLFNKQHYSTSTVISRYNHVRYVVAKIKKLSNEVFLRIQICMHQHLVNSNSGSDCCFLLSKQIPALRIAMLQIRIRSEPVTSAQFLSFLDIPDFITYWLP